MFAVWQFAVWQLGLLLSAGVDLIFFAIREWAGSLMS